VGDTGVVVVAGVAGSGKSTLGRELAAAMRVPLLDLDAVTNPLLDRMVGPVLPTHWLAAPHGELIREGRYAALRAVAGDVVATAGGAVLVAPFTAELAGGAAWDQLVAAVAPAEIRVVHLDGDPALLAARRATRGAPRDALIAATVPEHTRGLAFGFNRAADHLGAVVGPVLAFLLLTYLASDPNTPTARDYQQVQGFALITAFAFVVINLLVDLSYTFLDPRIRYS